MIGRHLLRPDLAEAWAGRGNVLAELQRYDEALAACNRATSSKPELAEHGLAVATFFSIASSMGPP